MRVLENVKPERVFYYFEELCGIPHGSKNTKQISDYCVSFAKEQGLTYYQDADNNIIIIKAATPGYEAADPVIIQGHLDMVCEKTADADIDMEKDGLQLEINGDEIRAKNTTLGGDDGIAVAIAMALLEDREIDHPRLEAVFTVDEEIGMLGAVTIDVSMLKGHTMLNLDSEDEGVFTVSCAGGALSTCILPLSGENYSGEAIHLTIKGLKGGHSGVEINKGRANGAVLMGRTLQELNLKLGIRLISVNSGLKDNAIPVDAEAVFVTDDAADASRVNGIVKDFAKQLQAEYAVTDATIYIQEQTEKIDRAILFEKNFSEKMILILTCFPNGIQKMSADIEGLVQTSLNIGIVKTTDAAFEVSFCVRSSMASEKEMLNRRLQALIEQLGGHLEISGVYPGWEYKQDSRLRELMTEIFRERYGHEPKIEAIHAGVECGMFAGKIEGLDCVSFGPDLKQIHTVRETMSISSVARVYAFVVEILRRLK